MAGPAEGLITALDMGSSKVSALIAQKPDDGASGRARHRPAREPGRQARLCRRHGAHRARRPRGGRAGRAHRRHQYRGCWVSFSAGGLHRRARSSRSRRDLGGHRIEQADIDALLKAGRDASILEGAWSCRPSRRSTPSTACAGSRARSGFMPSAWASTSMSCWPMVSPRPQSRAGVRWRAIWTCSRSSPRRSRRLLACLTDEERDLGVALVETGRGRHQRVGCISAACSSGLRPRSRSALGRHHRRYRLGLRHSPQPGRTQSKCFYGSATLSRARLPRDRSTGSSSPGEQRRGRRRVTQGAALGRRDLPAAQSPDGRDHQGA